MKKKQDKESERERENGQPEIRGKTQQQSKGGEKISAETVSVCVSEKDREIEERPSSTSAYVMERETSLQERCLQPNNTLRLVLIAQDCFNIESVA